MTAPAHAHPDELGSTRHAVELSAIVDRLEAEVASLRDPARDARVAAEALLDAARELPLSVNGAPDPAVRARSWLRDRAWARGRPS